MWKSTWRPVDPNLLNLSFRLISSFSTYVMMAKQSSFDDSVPPNVGAFKCKLEYWQRSKMSSPWLKILFEKYLFVKNWAIPALFFFIFVFSTVNSKYVQYKILLMTGFEPWTSEIGSDRSANSATTAAHKLFIYCQIQTQVYPIGR